MSARADIERDLKELIVKTLMLEDVTADDIETDQPLFEDAGLGLDSIDALELGMAIAKTYKIKLSQDPDENKEYFTNVGTLAAFVSEKLATTGEAS
ncbi:Acyl carrier protein [Sulfidibacter corallicola]|uniref:Acyl carrier protein n=1 Tax=Sulfidibacter corallicola TaxID=2818388 RepID=A0A8A4TKZ8_SULCO|nr:phosphopantetheine-binding protein [Sulfidibacter corallicola]QTD49551.1 acyl carrier protein [Sulfidibacter corallicola]